MEERELVGQWWLPDHPDRRVGGALRVEASGASRVKLTDALHLSGQIPGTGVVVPDHFATPAIVHGTAEGKYVTLISAALSGGSEHIGGDSPTIWQELKPVAVLVGIHLHNESDAVFEGIEVEIDNLTAWSSLSNISQRVET